MIDDGTLGVCKPVIGSIAIDQYIVHWLNVSHGVILIVGHTGLLLAGM
jgi:hypothetical protein